MMQLIVWYIHMTHITCICQCIMTANIFGVSLVSIYAILLVLVQPKIILCDQVIKQFTVKIIYYKIREIDK